MLGSQDYLLEMVWKALKVEMFMFMLASIHVFGGTFRFNVSRILRLIEIGWCHICHLFEVEKRTSFGLWEKRPLCCQTRNYRQICNHMCFLVTGTSTRRDQLVSQSVSQSVSKLVT